jgi:hypothetical protein
MKTIDGVKRVDPTKLFSGAKRHTVVKQPLVITRIIFGIVWVLFFDLEKTNNVADQLFALRVTELPRLRLEQLDRWLSAPYCEIKWFEAACKALKQMSDRVRDCDTDAKQPQRPDIRFGYSYTKQI